MDLNTITEVRRPASADAITKWENGFAWLAGGTWLFSEPQVTTHTLIDLETLKWPSLQASDDGLEIAATCRVVELDQFVEKAPPDWTAAALFRECCRSFLASFKIWNEANCRREYLHVAPGRADDFSHCGAGRRLHTLAAYWKAARSSGD